MKEGHAAMENRLFIEGGVAGIEQISSCPLHCRRVRQAAAADNVKAIYSHAAPGESSVYQCCKGLFLPSMFTVWRGNTCQEYWSICSGEDGSGGMKPSCMHMRATSISFMWLGRAVSIRTVFCLPDWQYLISSCLRFSVKPINRGQDQELNFFMAVVLSREAQTREYLSFMTENIVKKKISKSWICRNLHIYVNGIMLDFW